MTIVTCPQLLFLKKGIVPILPAQTFPRLTLYSGAPFSKQYKRLT